MQKRTMGTKTALVLGAATVLLLTGCAAEVQQQRHSNAAIEQIKDRRDACYADAALSIDDGVLYQSSELMTRLPIAAG